MSTLRRHEKLEMERVNARLRDNPKTQAQSIARHYCENANYSMRIMELIKLRGMTDDEKSLDECISFYVNQIKRNHREDLGIELEWQ